MSNGDLTIRLSDAFNIDGDDYDAVISVQGHEEERRMYIYIDAIDPTSVGTESVRLTIGITNWRAINEYIQSREWLFIQRWKKDDECD